MVWGFLWQVANICLDFICTSFTACGLLYPKLPKPCEMLRFAFSGLTYNLLLVNSLHSSSATMFAFEYRQHNSSSVGNKHLSIHHLWISQRMADATLYGPLHLLNEGRPKKLLAPITVTSGMLSTVLHKQQDGWSDFPVHRTEVSLLRMLRDLQLHKRTDISLNAQHRKYNPIAKNNADIISRTNLGLINKNSTNVSQN